MHTGSIGADTFFICRISDTNEPVENLVKRNSTFPELNAVTAGKLEPTPLWMGVSHIEKKVRHEYLIAKMVDCDTQLFSPKRPSLLPISAYTFGHTDGEIYKCLFQLSVLLMV